MIWLALLPVNSWIISAICCAGLGFSTESVKRTIRKNTTRQAATRNSIAKVSLIGLAGSAGWIPTTFISATTTGAKIWLSKRVIQKFGTMKTMIFLFPGDPLHGR